MIGLTGAVLVFQAEIDTWLNLELPRVVPPSPVATLLFATASSDGFINAQHDGWPEPAHER